MRRNSKNNENSKSFLSMMKVPVVILFAVSVVILGFTSVLNILSFKQSYTDALVRSYALAGSEMTGKIEYAVRYGKPLDNFYGMQDQLSELKDILPDIDDVIVVMPDGRMIYNLQGSVDDAALEKEVMEEITAFNVGSDEDYIFISKKETQYIFMPIHTRNGEIIGDLGILFDSGIIKEDMIAYIQKLITILFILSLLSVVLILFLYKMFMKKETATGLNRDVLTRSMLIVLAFSQIMFGYINYSIFKTAYIGMTRETSEMALNMVRRNVETVIDKGVAYDKLYDLDKYLQKIANTNPQINQIRMMDENNRDLYKTSSDGTIIPDEYLLSTPLKPDIGGTACVATASLSPSAINTRVREILLDAVTILVVSFFFMIEVIFMMGLFLRKRWGAAELPETDQHLEASLIRPLAFMVYGVVFMTAAFIPVMMTFLYKPFLGLPKDIVLGLPISAEMLCGLAATAAAGYFIDRKGWKLSFISGIVFFILGTVMSGMAETPIGFIAARGFAGAGFGVLVMAMRTMIIVSGTNTGIADMNAGATAGMNCGVVTGAMMADRIGFGNVLYISAALSVLALLFVVVKRTGKPQSDKKAEVFTQKNLFKFILDKQVLCFFVLILIPFSICAMFLNYYFPLYANSMGLSSSNIGRAFMLNGLCIVYLGPFLSKVLTNKLGNRKALIAAVSLTAFSILIFAVTGSVAGVFAALILIGISDSFGIPAQIGVFMGYKGVKEFGKGKAIAGYSLAGKFGQMLGPITYGAVALMGITKGIGLIAAGVLAALAIFVGLNKRINSGSTGEVR